MKITEITSDANPLLKKIRSLKVRSHREKAGQFLIEGPHSIEAAIEARIPLENILVSKSFLESGASELSHLDMPQVWVVEDKVMAEVVSTAGPCGILAVGKIRKCNIESVFEKENSLVVVCDAIQDPGNLGTIFRSSHASEAAGLILSRGCVDVTNPKVVRSAAGAIFNMPYITDIGADQIASMLEERGFRLVICEAAADSLYFDADLTGSVALVFGNEGQGIDPVFAKRAATSVAIPMNPKAESLNVAVSAGVILFEAYRQRLSKVR